MQKRLHEEDFKDIAINALHAACKSIQDAIGETDGGFASIYFSGNEDHILDHFASYAEKNYRELYPEDMDEIILEIFHGTDDKVSDGTTSLRKWINDNTEQSVMQISISEMTEVFNLAVGEEVEFFYGAGGTVTIKRINPKFV